MAEKNKKTDIDIDFPDRNKAASVLDHTLASIIKDNHISKHNTGVYFHYVPVDPITNLSSIDYEKAEEKGWFKFDLLNVSIYEQIKNENHLLDLMNRDIDWKLFQEVEFVKHLTHLHERADLITKLKPMGIEDLAISLAIIRPAKLYLIDRCKRYGFKSVSDEIWTPPKDGGFYFKKSHSVGYAMLVKVHATLLVEQALEA